MAQKPWQEQLCPSTVNSYIKLLNCKPVIAITTLRWQSQWLGTITLALFKVASSNTGYRSRYNHKYGAWLYDYTFHSSVLEYGCGSPINNMKIHISC